MDQAIEEEQILAAAQAQAQEEEVFAGHLPREVMSLCKRFDRQQQSVDELQGTISKLSEMVARLGQNLQAPVHARPPDPRVVDRSAREFLTPPHFHNNLSLVFEVSTPCATPALPLLLLP